MPSKIIASALTFNDVLIVPAKAEILPSDVCIKSRFSANISLNVPFVSSPMDTVTEYKLAIALALEGGIGVIHRNMSIEDEAEQVYRVKRYQSGKILDPYTLKPDNTVEEAKNLMQEKEISGIPIVDGDGKLVGILTRRDLQFDTHADTRVSEVMTARDLITAPQQTTLEDAKHILLRHHVEKLPLVDENFHLCGLITQKDIQKKRMFPHATQDTQGRLRVGAAVGATRDYYERTLELVRKGADVIVIDSAHGHSANVIRALHHLKNTPGMVDVVAGNIATSKGARELMEAGADAIRVGIGPGSICTTRIVTGCGVPQITAIMWAARAVRGRIPVVADGGIKFTGDVAKAIAAGASSVMLGSFFAGTEESPGKTVLYKGSTYKVYRGMGSQGVIAAGGDRYGSKAVPEGVEGMVPSRGPLAHVCAQLEGGLRQGMGYAGCKTIHDLQHARFVLITPAGMAESHPHDVIITEEAPNYPTRG